MSLMGVDIGTSGCKALVISKNGKILAEASRNYSLHTNDAGHVELDPNEVKESVFICIRDCNSMLLSDPVEAISFSSQGEAVIPVDSRLEPMAFSPISADMRGLPYVGQLAEALGEERIRGITGQLLDPIHSIFKIMWWNEHNHRIKNDCWKYCCFDTFLLLALGMPPVTDTSMASRMMLYDINKATWSSDILYFAGIRVETLPQVVNTGTSIGNVPIGVAKFLGFTTTVTVVSGGHDQPCAAFGNGLIDRGMSYSIGTTECISVIQRYGDSLKPTQNFPVYPHVFPNTTVTLIGSQTGTRVFRWIGDLAFANTEDSFEDKMDRLYNHFQLVPKGLKTSVLILPHLYAGSSLYDDPYAKAVMYGVSQKTQRNDILKAVMEGITFEQYLGYQKFLELGPAMNLNDSSIVATGGGVRFRNFLAMKADIFRMPIMTMKCREAGCIGVAMLAGLAIGYFSTPEDAVAVCIEQHEIVYPEERLFGYYQNKSKQYDILYHTIKEFSLGEQHASQ